MALRNYANYTIGTLQIWINDRRREAETEQERLGWIALDAWINRRVARLKARYPHQNVNHLPVFVLVKEDLPDE